MKPKIKFDSRWCKGDKVWQLIAYASNGRECFYSADILEREEFKDVVKRYKLFLELATMVLKVVR